MSRKEFHGGRSYSADPPEGGLPGPRLRLALAFGWIKLQFDRLLGRGRSPGTRSEPADVIVAQARGARSKQDLPDIFPMADEKYRPKRSVWPIASQFEANER